MARPVANFSDALGGIDQSMLDSVSELDDVRRMTSGAYLKIGALHGVTVEIEAPLEATGDVPSLVRQGLVIRCLLPKAIPLPALSASLQGGEAGRLIRTILSGHRLELTAEGGRGVLTRGAEQARNRLHHHLFELAAAAFAPFPAIATPALSGLEAAAV